MPIFSASDNLSLSFLEIDLSSDRRHYYFMQNSYLFLGNPKYVERKGFNTYFIVFVQTPKKGTCFLFRRWDFTNVFSS